MKTYQLEDGGTITAATPELFVSQLRNGSRFDQRRTDEQFMVRFAERYKIQTGKDINAENPETFIKELIRVGYIEEVR